MVKNPPANAGDAGSIPGPGRFPHTSGAPESVHRKLLSLHSTTTEARTPRALLCNEKAAAMRSLCPATKSSLPSPHLERLWCSNKDPAQPKINHLNKIEKKKKVYIYYVYKVCRMYSIKYTVQFN